MEVEEWGQRTTRSVAYIVPLELDCEESDAVNQPDERDNSSEGVVEEAVPSDYPVVEEAVPSNYQSEVAAVELP